MSPYDSNPFESKIKHPPPGCHGRCFSLECWPRKEIAQIVRGGKKGIEALGNTFQLQGLQNWSCSLSSVQINLRFVGFSTFKTEIDLPSRIHSAVMDEQPMFQWLLFDIVVVLLPFVRRALGFSQRLNCYFATHVVRILELLVCFNIFA